MEKKEISLKRPEDLEEDDKLRWIWTQFPLPQPVVIVSTSNSGGMENASPKSAIMPFLNEPDMIAFMCKTSHDTFKNIAETNEFTVNIPGIDLMPHVMKMGTPLPRGESEIDFVGLTSLKGMKNKCPLIRECNVHTECSLEWYKEVGPRDDVFIVGRMKNVIINDNLAGLNCSDRIKIINSFVIWPDGYSTISKANNLK